MKKTGIPRKIVRRLLEVPGYLVKQGCRSKALRFLRNTSSARAIQEEVLLGILRKNEKSEFGQKYGFAKIKSAQEFKSQVPIFTYEDLRSDIERVKAGQTTCLFGPDEKVLMFALTSGTTSKPKFIPVTPASLKKYLQGWKVWGGFLLFDHPDAFSGYALQVVSRQKKPPLRGIIPCGSISGFIADTQNPLFKLTYVGRSSGLIEEPLGRYYYFLRSAIEEDITFITTPNPSTLVLLGRLVDEEKEKIIKDVHDGTLSRKMPIPQTVCKRIERRLKPNKIRSRELERVVEKSGRLLPRDFWPHLKVLATWKGGSVSIYLPGLKEFFGDVPARDIGLVASEGRFTIPTTDQGAAGLLNFPASFFEFIPEDEIESEKPTTFLCDELAVGKNYFPLLTSSGGLYRYNILDLVRVVGYCYQAPFLEFLSKGKHFSSITGEKISEFQVVEAAKAAAKVCGFHLDNFRLAPFWATTPYYGVMLEERGIPEEKLKSFAEKFEENLGRSNIEYLEKRRSQRLDPIRVKIIPAGTFAQEKASLIAGRGAIAEQYKHPFLSKEIHRDSTLNILREIGPGPNPTDNEAHFVRQGSGSQGDSGC